MLGRPLHAHLTALVSPATIRRRPDYQLGARANPTQHAMALASEREPPAVLRSAPGILAISPRGYETMHNPVLSSFCVLVAVGALGAQSTSYIAPYGFTSVDGNIQNTIPFWSSSCTYQQVHDAADLIAVMPGPAVVIKSISFRKGTGATAGLSARTMDVQLTLGATPVTAATATATFASNFGPSTTVVLPYTNLSLPTQTNVSTPNPQSWFFPFATPFTYIIVLGNLCWEMRTKNCSLRTPGYNDAHQGTVQSLFGALIGSGCVATGQTAAASVGTRSLDVITGAFVHQLLRGSAAMPAAMILGAVPQALTLPGLCSSLQTIPITNFSGNTDATGSWNLTLGFGSLLPYPGAKFYTQFAFVDSGLPYGFGLSPCSPITLPTPGPQGATRIYVSPSGGGQGSETATVGTLSQGYMLITGFEI